MLRECIHIMPSGEHCQSPALRSGLYCYFHAQPRYRRPKRRKRPTRFVIPPLTDRKNLDEVLNQVLNAFAAGRLDERRAGLLIYGLRLAAPFTCSTSETSTGKTACLDSAPSVPICSVADGKKYPPGSSPAPGTAHLV